MAKVITKILNRTFGEFLFGHRVFLTNVVAAMSQQWLFWALEVVGFLLTVLSPLKRVFFASLATSWMYVPGRSSFYKNNFIVPCNYHNCSLATTVCCIWPFNSVHSFKLINLFLLYLWQLLQHCNSFRLCSFTWSLENRNCVHCYLAIFLQKLFRYLNFSCMRGKRWYVIIQLGSQENCWQNDLTAICRSLKWQA